jgi:hypothetical protein
MLIFEVGSMIIGGVGWVGQGYRPLPSSIGSCSAIIAAYLIDLQHIQLSSDILVNHLTNRKKIRVFFRIRSSTPANTNMILLSILDHLMI